MGPFRPFGSTPAPASSSTRPSNRPHAPDADGLPSAFPCFLEACARQAARAVAERDFAKARELI